MVGMAAFFAATAKAPTTSIIILFEMTNDYRIMLPLMAATVGSVYIYTLRLAQRGIAFPYGGEAERPVAKAPAPAPDTA